jgi:hypothetical protein
MPSFDDISDVSLGGDPEDGGSDGFLPAAELKRMASAQMAQERPGDGAPPSVPLQGFLWYAPFEAQARQQEQTLMEDVQKYGKPFPRPPYCFLCDSVGDDENPYRQALLTLADEFVRIDEEHVVSLMYRYYITHVKRLNGNKEWATHMIHDHLVFHDPKPLHLLVRQERITQRMIQARVQAMNETLDSSSTEQEEGGGGGNSRSTRTRMTQPCAKVENQVLKFMRHALHIHEAKRRALKEASTASGSGGGGGGSGGSNGGGGGGIGKA